MALIVSTFNSNAQNGIRFDGTDDYISVPNGSSMISGSSEISMSLWVYPENTTAGWPDFDGFAGFRNNTDADFYLMQLGASDVEARFRNSSGTTFTMGYNGLQLNAWNHFALTFDGTSLILYHNGSPVDTIPASGVINSTSTSFDMGYMFYTMASNSFYLQGKLDHVALWDRALTNTEVSALHNNVCEYDTSDANLVLSYEFSQGTVDGNNVAVTLLTDSKGNINGTFNNMSLTGTTSNFTTGINGASFNSISETACTFSYTVPSGNATYNTSGVYTDTLVNSIGCDSLLSIDLTVAPMSSSIIETACLSYVSPGGNTYNTSGLYSDTLTTLSGCDSVVSIDLTINTVDTTVTQLEDTLSAVSATASYQWLDCSDNSLVSGANGQSFTPAANGDFAVIVTENGCTDTSFCHTVTISSIGIYETKGLHGISAYPNPTKNNIKVSFSGIPDGVIVSVSDVSGKVILQREINNQPTLDISLLDEPDGIYFVKVVSHDISTTIRVVKVTQ